MNFRGRPRIDWAFAVIVDAIPIAHTPTMAAVMIRSAFSTRKACGQGRKSHNFSNLHCPTRHMAVIPEKVYILLTTLYIGVR